jgi:hypothetical protein
VAAVGDKDVPQRTGSVVYGEELETVPEERVGGIGNLDLLHGSFPLPVI